MKQLDTSGTKNWLETLQPIYPQFLELTDDERSELVQRIARVLERHPSTIARQFAALLYVEDRGYDPFSLRSGSSVLAIESIARTEMLDDELGSKLLHEFSEGYGSTQHYRAVFQRARRDAGISEGERRGGKRAFSLSIFRRPWTASSRPTNPEDYLGFGSGQPIGGQAALRRLLRSVPESDRSSSLSLQITGSSDEYFGSTLEPFVVLEIATGFRGAILQIEEEWRRKDGDLDSLRQLIDNRMKRFNLVHIYGLPASRHNDAKPNSFGPNGEKFVAFTEPLRLSLIEIYANGIRSFSDFRGLFRSLMEEA